MASQTRAIEAIELLARSEVRARLLEVIRQDGPVEARTLQERLDASRTTIRRNLDALEDQGWIEYDHGTGYALTPCGALITEAFFAFVDTMRAGLKLQPVFRWLAPADLDVDLRRFADADVVVAEQHDPYAPVNEHVAFLADADRFRGLVPSIGLQPLVRARESVVDRGQEREVVVSARVAETIRAKPEYARPIAAMRETGRCTVYEYDGDLPYYLGLSTAAMQLGLADETGKPQALVEAENAAAYEWARERYEEYRAAAEPLDEIADVSAV